MFTCHIKSKLSVTAYRVLCSAPESIAISSKQVREVLRSELSTSVPVTSPSSAIEATYSQAASLYQRLRDGEQKQQSNESAPQPGMRFSILPFNYFLYTYTGTYASPFFNIKALYFF